MEWALPDTFLGPWAMGQQLPYTIYPVLAPPLLPPSIFQSMHSIESSTSAAIQGSPPWESLSFYPKEESLEWRHPCQEVGEVGSSHGLSMGGGTDAIRGCCS